MSGLQFGAFDHLDRSGPSLGGFYEDRLQIVEAYDRCGFTGYHLAEHHATPLGMAPSPSVFLSAVAQRTKTLRFGPLVYILPMYHPLRLLEEICMLDQMSGGRLEFGVGRGISPVEAKIYGHDPAASDRMFAEALQIILTGLRGETIDFAGEFYQIRDAPMALEPVQKPHPPLWYGSHTPESAERAARKGYNVVCSDGTAIVRATSARFREVWDGVAAPGAPEPKIGMLRFVVVAETDAAALEIARRGYAAWYTSFNWLYRRAGRGPQLGERPRDWDAATADGRGVAGSAETVARVLGDQLAGTCVNYLMGQFAFGEITQPEAVRSIELFAERVAPVLRDRQTAPA